MARNRKIGSKAQKRWKQSMARLVDGLGRKIIVYLQDKRSECPNCYYDKVHDKSSGVYKDGGSASFTYGRCPICAGKGVITTSRKKCIGGMVIWNPQGNATNSLTFGEAGMEGATSVEIKTDVCNLDIIKDAKYVVLDGIKCKMSNPPIIRGVGGKSVLIAYFITMHKPRTDSGEYI